MGLWCQAGVQRAFGGSRGVGTDGGLCPGPPCSAGKDSPDQGSEIPAAHWGGGWEAPPSQALSASCFSILLTPMLT